MTKYEIKNTTQFKKDYKLAKRRGLDINLLKGIITKLANGEVLAPKHKDHPLSGDWVGHRECHIQPDWLLVYRYDNDVLAPIVGYIEPVSIRAAQQKRITHIALKHFIGDLAHPANG